MNNSKVSIIIPVYNVEKYLRQCLDSVINQTFRDIEIICVNDCSPDNSLQIIKEYQQKDNRINLINLEKNGGLANARNVGIKNAKSKYITFVDSDDWMTSDYIQVLYTNIEKFNCDFTGSEYYLYNDITKKISNGYPYCSVYNSKINAENIKKTSLLKITYGRVWATIYKKDFLISNDIIFRINKMEDLLFTYEAIIKASSFSFVKNRLYYYRIARKNSNVSTCTIYDRFVFHEQLQKLDNLENFKKYTSECYTYIFDDTAILLEHSKLPFRKLSKIFFDFREKVYDKVCKINYKYLNFRNKIRMFVFVFCLKHNLNYLIIGKLHNKFNPIRIFTKR